MQTPSDESSIAVSSAIDSSWSVANLTGLLGIGVILLIAWGLSTKRAAIEWRPVLSGLALQVVFAVLVLKVPGTAQVFEGLAKFVVGLLQFADDGARFVFGNLVNADESWGFIFAFKVLPIVIFFATLMRILYYLGIMQRLIAGFSLLLRSVLGVTGLESFTAATNVFVGQTEAPLAIKPYLAKMTRSQLMVVMTTGFATVAGSVMLVYVQMLGGSDTAQQELFAKHLLSASIMSAPGAFVIAKLMLPETEDAPDEALSSLGTTDTSANILDAATQGATDGLKLALNVGAMLIAFVALVAMINWPLQWLSTTELGGAFAGTIGVEELSLQSLLSVVLAPVGWLLGVGWNDAPEVGSLIGTQIIATEFIAYLDLAKMIEAGQLSPRSQQIATYALCGFCNVASIGIQLGAFSAMAPNKQADFSKLAVRAMFAGAMACWLTACVAGLLIV